MTKHLAVVVLGATLGSTACSKSDSPPATPATGSTAATTPTAGATATAATGAPVASAPPSAPPVGKSIGVATMMPDGTIQLQLRAESDSGAVGDALLFYPPSHPRYAETLKHLGGLKPGESKAVPPWP